MIKAVDDLGALDLVTTCVVHRNFKEEYLPILTLNGISGLLSALLYSSN